MGNQTLRKKSCGDFRGKHVSGACVVLLCKSVFMVGSLIEASTWLPFLYISNSLIYEACHYPKLCNGCRTWWDGYCVGVSGPSAANLGTLYICVCLNASLREIYHSPNSVSEASPFSQARDKLREWKRSGVVCLCV